jgi:hypothetical protein
MEKFVSGIRYIHPGCATTKKRVYVCLIRETVNRKNIYSDYRYSHTVKNYFKLSNGNTVKAEGGVAGLFSAPCRRFSNIAIFLPRKVELKNVSTVML